MNININQLVTYPLQTEENKKRTGIFLLYSFIINLLVITPFILVYGFAFLSPTNYTNLFEANSSPMTDLYIGLGSLLVASLYFIWSIFKYGLEIKQIQNIMKDKYEITKIDITDSDSWKKGLIVFLIRAGFISFVIILLTTIFIMTILLGIKSYQSSIILIILLIIAVAILLILILLLSMGTIPSVYYFLASEKYKISDIFSSKFLNHAKENFWKNVLASLINYAISRSIITILTVFLFLIPFSQIIYNPISDIISFLAKTSTYSYLYKLYYKNN